MNISTREFERAHGQKPRGTGAWAFTFFANGKTTEPQFAPAASTFAEAKAWAKATGRSMNATTATVCS